jgi:NAD(P)-dependent dehydrogenase (short-subunit alcohol dehydrogenase family)
MARVLITGSSDGLGRMAAQLLIEQGHRVVLHARNEKRRKEALSAVPGAETVVIGDLTSIAQTCGVAEHVNKLGSFESHGTRLPHNSDWSARKRGKILLMPKSNEYDSCDT